MNRLIDPNDIHSAADSWSGFIYQGKVALYHVLHLLNTDNNALNFNLQLDSLEDFAIVDAELNPITLHQVKAMKSTAYAAYRDAFEKLEKRFDEFPCKGAYFHLANQNERTAVQIKAAHPKLEVYEYLNLNHFCTLDQINIACEEQISIYLRGNHLQYHNNSENLLILRNSLESLIFNQIIEIHSCNHQRDGLTISEGAYHFVIPFNNLRDTLVTDPAAILDENYFLFFTKELINHYYLEFCQELEEEEEISDQDKAKLDGYLQQINALQDTSIVAFLQSILPHRTVKLNTIRDFKDNTMQREEFIDALLQSLYELVECEGKIGDNLTWKDPDNFIYTSTAINSPKKHARKVCKRIYENIKQTDIEVPYESDKLITSALELDSIEDELNLQLQVEERSDIVNNITKWSKISLTTLETAKQKLNEESN